MKFIVSSNSLQKKLQILGGVINSSNTIPILDHFLFQLENSKLTITSSDLETTMISSITVDSTSKCFMHASHITYIPIIYILIK